MVRIIFFLTFLCSSYAYSQEKENFRVMFWNVENLFDTQRDSLKQDEEFTPASMRGWNFSRYKKKMTNVARVITAVGEWEPPALVGLCEVENDNVLRYLTRYSALKSHEYQYVMTESADQRGIDVALLYQRDRFKLLDYNSIRPDLGPGERPTRDILHVTGLVPTGDTLDVMIAHLPSRSGGERESEHKRLLVAQVLRNAFDSLVLVRREARVLIMGDFNDYPENRSISEVLRVKLPDVGQNDEATLYHLLAGEAENAYGSYKYQGEWGLLDHLIVSGLLLDSGACFSTTEDHAGVVRLPFLLVEDEKFGGQQPFRTYNGMRYLGGYSDHLPVRVDFELIFD
ncbi:endonuclease/exonuclease/phosphatase family protein [Bacteroides sp. 51]|uniref:endonuclease/exonuclease/phosphatase family protein n=1 Tax=Bacteroides sp. 51 TaxID=2302938 RepID=UPI0013D56725|nr:endonuclease/exonuclease/phosphatase family protein [Bacteroides sp. 51]NDV83616.1 endonuclease [Bacteroides sp. 51]